MRAEEELQFMADFYPDLFPTRKHCLNHLFCVIGNGYEWENGELVNKDDTFANRYALKEKITKAEFRNEDHWNRMHDMLVMISRANTINMPPEYSFSWYELNKKYSKIYTAPDNIKPDWKALLEECKELLEKDGITLEEQSISLC